MSDSKKASPRKPGPDESATPQAAPPETSADDTAASPASQPAAVAEPEPARRNRHAASLRRRPLAPPNRLRRRPRR